MDCELSNMLLLPCLVFNVKVNQHVLQHLSLDLFMNSALLKQILSTYGTPQTFNSFKENYWYMKSYSFSLLYSKNLIYALSCFERMIHKSHTQFFKRYPSENINEYVLDAMKIVILVNRGKIFCWRYDTNWKSNMP